MNNFNPSGKYTETASKETQLWKSIALKIWIINSHNELVSTPIIILFYYNLFDLEFFQLCEAKLILHFGFEDSERYLFLTDV